MFFHTRHRRAVSVTCLWAALLAPPAWAEPPPCQGPLDRQAVVRCAVEVDPSLAGAQAEADAAQARVDEARVLLPSNPQLGLSLGRRSAPDNDPALNWALTLAQTIEVGGQRGLRIEEAEHQRLGSQARSRGARRASQALVLITFFEAVSALERVALSERLAALAEVMTAVQEASAGLGLGAPIDGEVAYAAGAQLLAARIRARAAAESKRAALALRLGQDPSARPALSDDLRPLPISTAPLPALLEAAARHHQELDALDAEWRAAQARVALLERARIPALTLSAFAQTDGFDETFFGGGLSLPVPLPEPLGHSQASEIAVAEAEARRAEANLLLARQNVQLQVIERAEALQACAQTMALYPPERVRRAEALLLALAEELRAGRLKVQEALASERALLELLEGHLDARRDLAVASVELAYAIGQDLEGEER